MQTSLFLLIVEIAGTIAFAISGIRLAAAKNFDWFGAYVVGLVTAIGGGTLRDVLLGTTPFWMQNGWYMGVTGLSLLFVIVFRRQWVRLNSTFFIFDTIGLALFVVIGMQKTLMFGYPVWTAIIMGTLTGAFGGVLRDILIQDDTAGMSMDVTKQLEKQQTRYLLQYSTIVVGTVPVMLLYPLIQRYFVTGIMVGAVKG